MEDYFQSISQVCAPAVQNSDRLSELAIVLKTARDEADSCDVENESQTREELLTYKDESGSSEDESGSSEDESGSSGDESGSSGDESGSSEDEFEERLNAMLYEDKISEDDWERTKSVMVTKLLLQGLQSQDPKELDAVLKYCKEEVIRDSVKMLSTHVLEPFFKELHKRVTSGSKNLPCLIWLRILLENHRHYLMTCPGMDKYFQSINQAFAPALENFGRLCKLDYLLKTALDKADSHDVENESQTHEALPTYKDESSDSKDDCQGMEEYFQSIIRKCVPDVQNSDRLSELAIVLKTAFDEANSRDVENESQIREALSTYKDESSDSKDDK